MHLLLLLLLITTALSTPDTCHGTPNPHPVYTTSPTLIQTTQNGKHFQTYATSPPINVVHVYGTPYEMGYAHGSLMKDEIQKLIPEFKTYIYGQIDGVIKFLPEIVREWIERYGTAGALMLTYEVTKGYTPEYWFEELKGIADGSGVDYDSILEIHMFPELIQAACSMVGAWGDATMKANIEGKLVQLRALDWATDGPFQQFPMVLVYHPNEGHPFSIVSWTGFVGTISGMSSVPFGVCEKVWLSYKGTESRFGYPWHFLLRDILQFDNTTDDAINRISHTTRTCSIFIGLGTPDDHFKVIEYSHDYFNVYDDRNYPVYKEHPRMNDVVYVDKHVQPSHNSCLADILTNHYGTINATTLYSNVVGELQTGDMQACVYDYANMAMFVSNASPYIEGKPQIKAYDNIFTRFDMKALFAEKLN